MSKIIILGSGMVGSAMGMDLAGRHDVTITDLNEKALQRVKERSPDIKTHQLDLSDKKNLTRIVKDFDLVVSAVPGFMGFETLKTVIKAEKDVVDISFFPENALDLNEMAEEKNVTAIVDIGVAPGMHNLLLGYYNEKLEITDFECLVGGLPKVKKWPFCYKAPFSPIDVIEEYIRPARFVENGEMVTREALSDCEYVEFEDVGTLEAFNTDGLRSLIFTMPHIRNMKEKTLRYPGHVEYIKVLKESGFFDTEEITVDGRKVRPIDFTAKILIDEWKLEDNEEELTVMRVSLLGKNGRNEEEKVVYELYDEYCKKTGVSSMARTTGYTATAAANMYLEGLFTEKGVFPPELIGKHEPCFNYILDYLDERGVQYTKSVETR